MNFADKLFSGLSNIIHFLGKLFGGLGDLIAKSFNAFFDFLAKPLGYLMSFLEAIFYFFEKLFDVVVMIVKIFVACFQFIGALVVGLLRTISSWLHVTVSGSTNFPSASGQGFTAVINQIMPTGVMTVIPLVAIGFLWLFFIIKIIGLFGGEISINPFRGGNG